MTMRNGVFVMWVAAACASPKPAATPPSDATATPPVGATTTPPSHATPTPRASVTAAPPASATSSSPPIRTPVPTGGSVFVGEIDAGKNFDPKRTLDASTPALLDCYNKVRATQPALSGKLTLHIVLNELGVVIKVESQPGGAANVPELVACIQDALRATPFPKPGGIATVIAPLLFRP
jgi:hypothetical protein